MKFNLNQIKGKPLSGQKKTISPSNDETSKPKWVASRDSQPNPESKLEIPQEVIEGDILQYHLTARIVNSQLGPREFSLLLEILEYQIVNWSCTFAMYLTLIELYQRCLGQKTCSDEINDPKIRLTCLVAEILINDFKGEEFSLDTDFAISVSEKVKLLLQDYLMNKRTYRSRFAHWRPERFVLIRAVPVSAIFERPRLSLSERYSGYTKGYGESHGNAHQVKTKPSCELDGDPTWPDKEERNLFLRMTSMEHQKANQLWIKFFNLTGNSF